MHQDRRSRAVAIIPARLHSTRLPRKLLLRATGRSVLEHTYRQVLQAASIERTVIATADPAIADEVTSFGGEVAWTSPTAASGTDRLAELAPRLNGIDILVNVQGDEPEISPEYVDQLVALIASRPAAPAATLAAPTSRSWPHRRCRLRESGHESSRRSDVFQPQSDSGRSRRTIAQPAGVHWQHLGIYAYRRKFLCEFAQLPPSLLEAAEQLEQLRILEAGLPMLVGTVPEPTCGIDTLADYEAFVRRQNATCAAE